MIEFNKKQCTLKSVCQFEGKGLHSGKVSKMLVCPAEVNTGIVFQRVDIGEDAFIPAVAENVISTARSTTIAKGEASVSTIEHLMSSLYAMGIDNALVKIDNVEVPILDGSASYYIKEFTDNIVEQDADRKVLNIDKVLEIKDTKTGSWIRISPAEKASYDIEVDFNSKVLGVQKAHWDVNVDFTTEIGLCRTFVFFHELEFLFANNLIKGGDVDNAIVIVEHPVTQEQIDRLSKLFNKEGLSITSKGYLNNLKLHFSNECARHKMLDMLGDMSLVSRYLNVKIEAFKPGHGINTLAAKMLRTLLK